MRQRSPRTVRLLLVAALIAIAAAAVLAIPALAQSGSGDGGGGSGLNPIVPSGVSPNGQNIHTLYLLISIPAIAIFLLVEILLLIIIFKWRRSRLPADYKPPQWHGNNRLEFAWTAIPFILLIGVGWLSFRELQTDFVTPSDNVTQVNVSVLAHQFGWTYVYDNGVTVSSEGIGAANSPLVVPTGELVRLRLDSRDVIHSFWVPDINGKTDAVPGYSNYTWLKIDQPGEWRGECAELCGVGHATMQIRVKAVSPDDFRAWLAQQKAASNPKPTPSPGPSASPSASPSVSPGASPAASPSVSPAATPRPSPSGG